MDTSHYFIWSITKQAWLKGLGEGSTKIIWDAGLFDPLTAANIEDIENEHGTTVVTIPATSANPLIPCPGYPHPEDTPVPEGCPRPEDCHAQYGGREKKGLTFQAQKIGPGGEVKRIIEKHVQNRTQMLKFVNTTMKEYPAERGMRWQLCTNESKDFINIQIPAEGEYHPEWRGERGGA